VAAASDWIFERFVIPFLDDVPITTTRGSAIFNAWSGFRIIANITLVGILVAVALSQAAGKQ
jgi:hypothetical protein